MARNSPPTLGFFPWYWVCHWFVRLNSPFLRESDYDRLGCFYPPRATVNSPRSATCLEGGCMKFRLLSGILTSPNSLSRTTLFCRVHFGSNNPQGIQTQTIDRRSLRTHRDILLNDVFLCATLWPPVRTGGFHSRGIRLSRAVPLAGFNCATATSHRKTPRRRSSPASADRRARAGR